VLNRLQLERWLFGAGPGRRRTQDSPILPDVWYAYALPPSEFGQQRDREPLLTPRPGTSASVGDEAEPCPEWEVDLLLRAHAEGSSSDLARALHVRLERPREATELAFNESYVACRLTFLELLRVALPLTDFWQTQLWPGHRGPLSELLESRTVEIATLLETPRRVQGRQVVAGHEEALAQDPHALSGDLVWLIGVVGRIAWEHTWGRERERPPSAEEVVNEALQALGRVELGARAGPRLLWTVNCNRRARTAVWRSRVACKADAATHLFKTSCRAVRWAVIDSGVDARHPAFANRPGGSPLTKKEGEEAPGQSGASRVAGTWDFVTLRKVLTELPLDDETRPAPAGDLTLEDPGEEEAWRVESWVARGRAVDWELIAPQLAIPHDASYRKPEDDHGTHVAGILMGDWRSEDRPSPGPHDIQGMCTDMTIYDLRAFDEEGRSDEFQVLSAMQFVRYLNAHDDLPVVHGVNLSFSIEHEVDTYAAGATPVCQEAHRLIASGVVVVASAGNEGRGGYVTRTGVIEGYRSISITDPGNAEKVITVGSTHGERPHTYGVSYFSSRGPTGDGRAKPDLVAPGEKITSAVPGAGLRTMDGTSQAAPHVSGACALLMARHPELVGQPERVKQIICESCTDLGRERSFQGAGMVDVLRAIQAV
jgi:serine protease AprX